MGPRLPASPAVTLTLSPPLTAPISQQREVVSSGATRPLAWRLAQLERFERALTSRTDAVLEALAAFYSM